MITIEYHYHTPRTDKCESYVDAIASLYARYPDAYIGARGECWLPVYTLDGIESETLVAHIHCPHTWQTSENGRECALCDTIYPTWGADDVPDDEDAEDAERSARMRRQWGAE